jgi:hypothetical protein
MGIFSFLNRSKARPSKLPVMVRVAPQPLTTGPSPHDLRQKLFDAAADAAASGNEEQLCDLCQRHEKLIFEQGMIWARVPPEIRANPKLAQWYGSGLRSIAKFCAQRLGKPELMNQVRQLDLPADPPRKKS